MLRASLEAAVSWRATVFASMTLQPPAALSTRCLILKAHGVEPQLPRAAEEDKQMKASALFGAGWDHDSIEVLWQDAGRAFCRCWRDDVEGEKHAFIPVLSGALFLDTWCA